MEAGAQLQTQKIQGRSFVLPFPQATNLCPMRRARQIALLLPRVAMRFLGVTGAEMEGFLLSGQPSIGFIERANRRAIDRLFKER
jgi:hypothetical protein